MGQVLDYSAGFPGAAAIKQAGYSGAVRYIGFPNRTKCTTAGELADFTRVGIGMALVYQDAWRDFDGGYNAGVAAAGRARKHADAIGFPQDRPIYFAIDTDVVTAAEFDRVTRYLRGAGSVLGGAGYVGVYGERDVTVHARRQGVASWFWQTRAWSGTPVQLDPERHLYQRVGYVYVNGIACDANDVLKADWGQHTEEVNMPSAKEIAEAVWGYRLDQWDGPGDKNTTDKMHAGQQLNQARGFARAGYVRVGGRTRRIIDLVRKVLGKDESVDVAALADELAPRLNAASAKALADEIARRMQS